MSIQRYFSNIPSFNEDQNHWARELVSELFQDSYFFVDFKIHIPGRCCFISYFDTMVLDRSCYFHTTATSCSFLYTELEVFVDWFLLFCVTSIFTIFI